MSDIELEEDVDGDLDDIDQILAEAAGEGGSHEGHMFDDVENALIEANEDGNRADDGEDVSQRKEVKKKRVVLNPQPKLNYQTLTGKRGLCAIKDVFAGVKLKGKGHELSDLNQVLTKLEYWTHRLYPRYNFDEVLSRIEKLGSKKQVQVYVKRMRLGMEDLLNPVSNEFVEDEPPSPSSPPPLDQFDSLLPTVPNVPTSSNVPPATQEPQEITEEQRERMIRNRKLAEERRMARMKAAQEEVGKQN